MDNFVLGRYLPLNSCIHKMDPRAKIGAMLFVLVAVFFPAGWIGYAILFFAISTVTIMGKLPFGMIWKSMKPMRVMLLFLLVINVLVTREGTPLLTIADFTIYQEAVVQTLYIAFRLLLMVMITTCLTATTKPLDMTIGIEDLLSPFQKLGCPSHEIAMLISIALRFIPDLISETNRIIKAQESRGMDLKEGKLKEKIMAILSLIVPLFVSAFQRAEDLANAMEARGYAPGQPRTRYRVLKMQSADYLLLVCSVGLLLLMIGLSVIL